MLQDINEISDGKIYGLHDMVRVSCNDCEGCHACCEQMGTTVLLDPLDVFRLTKGLGKTFQELMAGTVELHVEDGLVVPNLKMAEGTERCVFLNKEGRCSIHAFRPGICRLFPLGRIYGEDGVSYFLQNGACRKENRSKVKVVKWLDTPEPKAYQKFLADWHSFKKGLILYLDTAQGEQAAKTVAMFLLNQFFVKPYDTDSDFYPQFYERLREAKGAFGLAGVP